MPTQNWIIVDVATAPVPDAETYLDGTVRAPSNYKDEEKIAAYIAEKQAERLAMAATDIDLAMVTAIDSLATAGNTRVYGDAQSGTERGLIDLLGVVIRNQRPTLITYGGFDFDLPLLMRRARYLGVDFPAINLDRYKSPHIDLMNVLSDRNPQRRRSLDFYCKRMGWTDLCPKPLTGADEAQVPVTGRWDELAASLKRDVTAIYRLACWLGVIQPVPAMSAEQIEVGL